MEGLAEDEVSAPNNERITKTDSWGYGCQSNRNRFGNRTKRRKKRRIVLVKKGRHREKIEGRNEVTRKKLSANDSPVNDLPIGNDIMIADKDTLVDEEEDKVTMKNANGSP